MLLALLTLALCTNADASDTPTLSAALSLDQSYVIEEGDAWIRLTLENHAADVQTLPTHVLFGGGLTVTHTSADVVEVFAVAATVPDAAPPHWLLPPGGSVTVPLNLGALSPEACAQPGELTVVFDAGTISEPLTIPVWRDCSDSQVVLETEFGEVEIGLYFEKAPRTVQNFIELTDSGFYQGLSFHRIVPEFMIQGGCPIGDGTGNSGEFIPFEPNSLLHERGTVSMARQADLNSASCQFFICLERKRFLDGNYTAFGKVIRGMDVVDKMAAVERVWAIGGVDDVPSKPATRVEILGMRVEEVGPERGPGDVAEEEQ